MSHSHADVGKALADLRFLRGSRMESVKATNYMPPPAMFSLLGEGYSYKTSVARVVRNNVSCDLELWITPTYYSVTTNRHIEYYRRAFAAKHGASNIFVTSATSVSTTRCDHNYAKIAISVVEQKLYCVDAPRIREATRRGTIASCLGNLAVACRNMATGVPEAVLSVEERGALRELRDVTHFLDMLQETPDIDEVRAAVRAHLALNNPQNN